MGLLRLFKKKEPPVSNEDRIKQLTKVGRITDGMIIDYEIKPNGEEIVFYVYTLNGVDFESSEMLSDEQRKEPLKYAPGAKVGIRYDPKNQGNSMLV